MEDLIKSIIEKDGMSIAFELATIIGNADILRNIGMSLLAIAIEKKLIEMVV